MHDLQVFQNNEFGEIRTLTIEEEPWFVGKDVAVSLGYTNPRKAVIDHVDMEDKNSVTIRDGIRGNPNMTIINESGLYSLIFSSKLPSAKRFKRWVTSEVLPSIRKTGSYSTHPVQMDYLQAAKIVASCKPDRLHIVLSLLKSAGLILPELKTTYKKFPRVANHAEISSLMVNNGVSLRELSRRTGIPKSSLSYYARGIHRPTNERYNLIIAELSN